MDIISFLSVSNIFFSVAGYDVSYLEFAGTLFNLASAWLIARSNIWNWSVGIVGIVLFAFLFYQIQLYSDFFEQIYYFVTGLYGWWMWSAFSARFRKGKNKLLVTTFTTRQLVWLGAGIAACSLGLGAFMSHIHTYLPAFFPQPASFPYVDAFTTVMCFFAQWMMTRKKLECWYIWIFYNAIGIGLYAVKGVIFVSGLYVMYFVLAFISYVNWKKLMTPGPAAG
jgi:nicotinamide mononucleotide transporter